MHKLNDVSWIFFTFSRSLSVCVSFLVGSYSLFHSLTHTQSVSLVVPLFDFIVIYINFYLEFGYVLCVVRQRSVVNIVTKKLTYSLLNDSKMKIQKTRRSRRSGKHAHQSWKIRARSSMYQVLLEKEKETAIRREEKKCKQSQNNRAHTQALFMPFDVVRVFWVCISSSSADWWRENCSRQPKLMNFFSRFRLLIYVNF